MVSVGWTGLALALAGGMGLGALYFSGLWWTVCRLPAARHPALLMMASLVVRVGGLLVGLWLLAAGEWQGVAVALAGILVVRTIVVRILGPSPTTGKVA